MHLLKRFLLGAERVDLILVILSEHLARSRDELKPFIVNLRDHRGIIRHINEDIDLIVSNSIHNSRVPVFLHLEQCKVSLSL